MLQFQHEGGREWRARLNREIMAQTGIDEVMIEWLVRSFYLRVKSDLLLGAIFAVKVADWAAHITKLCSFWSSVVLMFGRYHGSPMQMHLSLPIERSHFDRWLALFEETATNLCRPDAAAHFVEWPRRTTDSIEFGVSAQQRKIQNPRHQTARRILFKTEAQSDKRSEWNPITSIGAVL